MFIRSYKLTALAAAAYLALPLGVAAAAEQTDPAAAREDTYRSEQSAELQGTEETQAHCDYGNQNKEYISKDPAECATIQFICAEGYQKFYTDCGCGCERISP